MQRIPPKIKTLLKQITDPYQTILGDNLVGIYIHGSLALGCFNWEKSDIDFIAVVRESLSAGVKLSLLDAVDQLKKHFPPKGIEMSVVLKEFCVHFQYPTPYELHFSNDWEERYHTNPMLLCDDRIKTDYDLAAHFTVLRKAGISFYGPPVTGVFGDVPVKCYLDSIQRDVGNAEEDILACPLYVVLNLCRVLAYRRDGLILSKKQGGNWGIENLPAEYGRIIEQALYCYRTSEKMTVDEAEARKFSRFMTGRIFSE